MTSRMKLSITSLIAAFATIFSGGAALAQSPTTTASTAPATTAAPTTTVPKPALLSTDIPKRPADCTKAATMAAYAAKLDAIRKEALALRDDDAVAKAYGKDIDKFVDKVRRAQLALPSWCQGAGTPTTTTIAPERPGVLDDNLASEPSSCDNPAEVTAWNSQLTGYLARLDAVNTPANQQWASEIKEKRDAAIESRDSLMALCAEKNPPVTKAPAAKTKSARTKAKSAPPATAAPARVKKVSMSDCNCDWVEVRR